jgi:putative membrane protein
LLFSFFAASPFALVDRLKASTPLLTVPLATVLIAMPILAIDKIGTELQYPFSTDSLNHLPLDDICATIEGNLLALLRQESRSGFPA